MAKKGSYFYFNVLNENLNACLKCLAYYDVDLRKWSEQQYTVILGIKLIILYYTVFIAHI